MLKSSVDGVDGKLVLVDPMVFNPQSANERGFVQRV
jgi:hypothetical protein